MQIQLNTGNNVQGDDKLAAWADAELRGKFERFRDSITRIEVHLNDVNAARGGDSDKRCTLEARPAGRQPVAVTHDAGTVAEALHGARDKLLRALDSALGKARDSRGRDSIRGGEAGEV